MFEWKNYKKKKGKGKVLVLKDGNDVKVKFKLHDPQTAEVIDEITETVDFDTLVSQLEDLNELIHDLSEAKSKKEK